MGWTRRFFLGTAAVAGGGLMIGGGALAWRHGQILAWRPPTAQSEHALGAWLKISEDGRVTLMNPRAEMGQGSMSTMVMIVADELGVAYDAIVLEDAPVAPVFRNVMAIVRGLPIEVGDSGALKTVADEVALQMGILGTGGSNTATDSWNQLRGMAAGARTLLVLAAARKMQLPASELDSDDAHVVHARSGRNISFGEIAAAAARMDWPNEVMLRDPARWRYIGKSPNRLDIPSKTNGTALFGIDVRLPRMHYAALRHTPSFGSTITRISEKPGFRAVGAIGFVNLGNAVAVVAPSYWVARQGLDELDIETTVGSITSDEAIYAAYATALEGDRLHAFEKSVQLPEAKQAAVKTLRAEYQVPFLAHACMEPMNATALYQNDRLELWCGNQVPTLVRDRCAKACGIDKEVVTVHTMLLGGGFGRRADPDYAIQAALIAKAHAGTPVQLIWSREEDTLHDFYRPSALARYEGGLNADGSVAFWHARSAHPSVGLQFQRRNVPFFANERRPDRFALEAAERLPYRLGARQVEYVRVDTDVPIGNWRAVNNSQNGFFVESFIDELAAASKEDPMAFRAKLLKDSPRHLAVLNQVASISDWGRPPARRFRGVAIVESFRSIVAEVVEVSGDSLDTLKVERIWAAVDCGFAIDPRNAKAQVQSAIVYGLTAALWGRIQIRDGRAVQSNFNNYRMLKLAEAPRIDVSFVDQGSKMGGMGEVGLPPLAPALANAVFAATGQRLRSLPLMPSAI